MIRLIHLLLTALFLCSFVNCNIPSKYQKELTSAVYEVFGTTTFDNCISFADTPTNWASVFKVEINNNPYIFRLLNKSTTSKQERKNEINLTYIMSEITIAPKLYYGNPETGIMVMEYIKQPQQHINITHKQLKLLAVKLKKLHSINVKPYIGLENHKLANLFIKAEKISANNKNFSIFLDAIRQYKRLQNLLITSQNYHTSLCHQDLNRNNILFEPEDIKIIDWDLAIVGDSYYDLATVINTFTLTVNDENFFLEQYFSRPLSFKQKDRIYLMKILSLLRYAITTFALCDSYNDLPPAETLQNKLYPPFVFPLSKDNTLNKNIALYMHSLTFYNTANNYLTSKKYNSIIKKLRVN